MSIGAILAFLVLVAAFISLVFAAAAPAWLPMALIGALALSILLSPFPVTWPGQP